MVEFPDKDDDLILKTDIMSHASLNAFMDYEEAMCQCEAICKCPGYEDEDE
jgi:hypothetical protein